MEDFQYPSGISLEEWLDIFDISETDKENVVRHTKSFLYHDNELDESDKKYLKELNFSEKEILEIEKNF